MTCCAVGLWLGARAWGWPGVIAASGLSVVRGPQAMLAVFGVALFLGWALWWRAPQPVPLRGSPQAAISVWQPLAQPAFRRLLAVFMSNGIASAIPAALMLFFAQDRLRASEELRRFFWCCISVLRCGLYAVVAARGAPSRAGPELVVGHVAGRGLLCLDCRFGYRADSSLCPNLCTDRCGFRCGPGLAWRLVSAVD